MFAREGGPQALLSLTQKSGFRGFASLVTLLFKHCLEDGLVLRHAMEGVIRASVTNPFFSSKEARPQAMGGRELYYIMRKLGPCACRNPQLFMEVASNTVRLCSEPPSPAVYSASQRSPTTLVKCAPPSKVEHVPLNSVQSALVNLLIDHLCAEETGEEETKAMDEKPATAASAETKVDEEGEVSRAMHFDDNRRGRARRGSYRRQLTAGTYDDDDVNSEDMAVDGEETGGSRIASAMGAATANSSPIGERDASGSGTKTEGGRDQPLMSKAAILRLLSELVESYPSCAKLIAESSRKVKVHGKPAKDMTVLAFIFDYLLPASSNASGKVPPIAKLSKTFIQCLAVSHPSPEIISLLVTEFKHALTRALSLPESTSKHNRIRSLTGLLSQISDYITAARGALNPSHFARLLIRKGFISDLARAVHSLNLSSPMLPGTVNSILKPLEVLTKMVNQVAAASKKGDTDKGPTSASITPGQGGRVEGGQGEARAEYQGTNQVTITVDTAPARAGENQSGDGAERETTSQADVGQEAMNARSTAAGG
jgi:E3 ubiquitin-protein ligase HUWE1